ncbi:hypothetical protein Ancab_018214 [Ancistrocladus abbreviatus]
MAALQRSPIDFRPRSTPPPPSRNLSAKPLTLSFSSTFNSLELTILTTELSTSKSRPRRAGSLGARMADTAASSYATAVAEVAKSNGTLESTSSDMEKINEMFSDPQVYNFFANPILGTEKKRVVLDEIVKSSSLQPHTANFLNILVDMKRLELINDIVKEFEVVYNKMTDTEMALVTSVVKLESQHLAQIARGVQRLTGAKNVRIKTQIDPSLVAGFTIRYGKSGSKLIDMSVKKQLEEIAAQLDLGDIQVADLANLCTVHFLAFRASADHLQPLHISVRTVLNAGGFEFNYNLDSSSIGLILKLVILELAKDLHLRPNSHLGIMLEDLQLGPDIWLLLPLMATAMTIAV